MTSSGGETTIVSGSRGLVPETRPPADLIENDEVVHIRILAHGLGREDVKVTVQENVLVIKAGAKKDSPTSCKFEYTLDLFGRLVKTDEIEVLLMDGMLYVVVPKVNVEMGETDEAVHIRVKVTGLTREDVKVTVQENVLVIEVGAKDSPTSLKSEARINLPGKPLKTEEMEVELMDGMLYVVLPKVKDAT